MVRSRRLPVAPRSNRFDLLHHLAVVADFVLVGREVAVPQQRHLLLERVRRLHHPVRPPVPQPARFEHRRAQPVEEAIGDRLYRTVAGRFGIDAHRRAGLQRAVRRFGAAFRKSVQRRIPEPGLDERLHLRIRDGLVVDKRADRALEAKVCKLLDLCRRPAEPRVSQQVRGAVVIPVRIGDRREVVLPVRRSRRPADASGHVVSPACPP